MAPILALGLDLLLEVREKLDDLVERVNLNILFVFLIPEPCCTPSPLVINFIVTEVNTNSNSKQQLSAAGYDQDPLQPAGASESGVRRHVLLFHKWLHPVHMTVFALTIFVPRFGLGPKGPESCDWNWVYYMRAVKCAPLQRP